MLPSRPPSKPTPTALPLLPLAAAAFILLGSALVAQWWWASRTLPLTSQNTQANPFTALVKLQQREALKQTLTQRQPQRLPLPSTPPVQVLGNAAGTVVMSLFLDPAMASHRRQLQAWLGALSPGLTPNVRAELHYLSAPNSSLAGGVAWGLASRSGKAGLFWQQLRTETRDLNEPQLFGLLNGLGIPMATIRAALQADGVVLQALQPTLAWANQQQVTGPLLLLNGYPLDGQILHPTLLPTYLQRLQRNEALIQPDDLFIMQK